MLDAWIAKPDAAVIEELAAGRQITSMHYERARWQGLVAVQVDEDRRVVAVTAPGCNLTELPASLGSLERLGRLDVSRNLLDSLPDSIGELTALRELYLYDNQVHELPASIAQLAALEVLDANRNALHALPALHRLHALEYLYVEANRLDVLPSLPETLRYLNITHNRVGSLAPIRELVGLVELRAERAGLQDTPDVGGLVRLRELHLGGNGFLQLPTLPPPLEVLSVRDGIWTEFPRTLAGHPSLSRIDVRQHFLDDVPAFVVELPRLRRLDLRWNRLRAPRDWAAKLAARDVLVYF